MTLVRHKKPGLTTKCMFDTKNTGFDTKLPGSTQKCHPQHASVGNTIIRHLPHSVENICFQFWSNILFKKKKRNDNEIMLILIQIYSIWLPNLKCNDYFLLVMIIMSAATNKCYRCGRISCQFLHCVLIAPLKSETHVAHCWINNELKRKFHNYSQ